MGSTPRFLKELTAVISLPLTILFNASLELGKLPDEWGTANITAIYKKGSRQVCGNYRPISLTCIACKVLESIVREQLIDYLKKNKLFSNKQFGFLGGRSTTLQLLKVLDNWTDILDRGSHRCILWLHKGLLQGSSSAITHEVEVLRHWRGCTQVDISGRMWQVGFCRDLC